MAQSERGQADSYTVPRVNALDLVPFRGVRSTCTRTNISFLDALGEDFMSIYITQGRFTEHAMKGMLGKPEDRGPEVQKLVEAAGGKFIAYYMTMGEYDFLLITEGQGEEDVLAALVVAGAGGGVTGLKTTQAFTTATGKKVFERAGKIAGAFRSAGT